MNDPSLLNGCVGKRRYGDEQVARDAAARIWLESQWDMRVYACVHCGGFHLTHKQATRVKPGWRPPRLSQREEARRRKSERRRRR